MKSKILTVLSTLVGLLMINGGLNKFLNYIPVPEGLPEEVIKDGMAMMEISWLMPLIAIAEIAGGLLLIFPKTRALGVLILFPVMVGVLLNHITVAPSGLPMVLVIWAILIWIICENRQKYLGLLR